MSKKDEQQGTVTIDPSLTEKWNDRYFKLNNRRMNRKVNFEEQKFQERQKQQPQQPQLRPAPFPPAEQFAKNLLEIKQKPIEQREDLYNGQDVVIKNFVEQLKSDETRDAEQKKPVAQVLKDALLNLRKEMQNDENAIKQVKENRKKDLVSQITGLKPLNTELLKVPDDKGPVSKALGEYRNSMSLLVESAKQEMTTENFNKGLGLVKKTRELGQGVFDLQNRLGNITNSKKVIDVLNWKLQPDGKELFNKEFVKQVDKDTDRTIKGHGELFKPVLTALKLVETDAKEENLLTLEKAANNYLSDYNRRVKEGEQTKKPFKPDKIAQAKFKACNDALEKVRQLRARREIQGDFNNLPPNPQSREEEASLNRVRAKMIIESGGSKQLGEDESGASESFFLTDPTTGKKNFIFKPSDGEFDAGYGWPKGGGAPREVALSSVNDIMKNATGLDCGVSTTTLVKVNSPTVATGKNGNSPQRTGAIQNFVNADKVLSGKLNPSDTDNYDKNYINQIPQGEIEKVAILDFATLQMDRQGSNLLVHTDDQTGQPRLTPIDAGNALPSRKGFEASRRMFTNNALFSGDEGKKPFSKEAMEKIELINEDDVVAGMKKANEEMAKVDPNAATAVGDENMEMARRSIRFMKAAAKAGLSKAAIADAYAYSFHKVLDAKPADKVDAMIQQVIQEQLDKPNLIQEIENFPNAKTLYVSLGWHRDEFVNVARENPALLLKILKNKKPNRAALMEIDKTVKEIGRENLDFDPNSIADISDRLSRVRLAKRTIDDKKSFTDPQNLQKMQELGWDFTFVNDQNLPAKYTTDSEKSKHVKRMKDYIAAGGDDGLRQKGLDPAKLSMMEKTYHALGGDAKLNEWINRGFDLYNGPKMEIRVLDLQTVKEYEQLGGDEAYVKVGGPQNKEVNIVSRVDMLKQKQLNAANDEVDWRTGDEMLDEMVEMLKVITKRQEDFTQAEQNFEKKRALYARYAQEADQPMDQQAKQQRLEELKQADDEVGEQMKQFGKWNRDVITPWKDMQRRIEMNDLANDPKVKQLNRKVTQGYDAYVVAFGAADDLGKDQLDLLRGLTKRLSGQKPTVEQLVTDIKKLGEQMTSGSFGACTKVKQQLDEVVKIARLVSGAKPKVQTFQEQDWELLADWDTKIRQAFEISKANFRATQRGKFNGNEYLKQSRDPSVVEALKPAALAIKQAETEFQQTDKFVTSVLSEIEKLEKLRPVG